MLPSHLFFPFGLILISYTSWWVKNPNLKAQLLSDVLWLCDRTGAAASEHQNWSPNLLVSLKSRQTSCCPPAAVRGLTGLCVILLDLTGLPKPSPGCWLGTHSAVLCWSLPLLQLLSTVAAPFPLEVWNIQYRGMNRGEGFHFFFLLTSFSHYVPTKKVSWL